MIQSLQFDSIYDDFSHIFTAHVRKRPFPVKILTSAFYSLTPISLQSTIFQRFEVVVYCCFWHCIYWMSAILYSRSSWPTDLESVSRVAYLTVKVSTSLKLIWPSVAYL